MNKFKKFQIEEMVHHDKEAKFYAKRNETDYIWEVPAERFLLTSQYLKKGSKIVDMGCGPSILIKHIIPQKFLLDVEYIGVDISKEMLKIAKKNIPSGRFIQGDMETVTFSPGSVDVIISLGALHHSQNKKRTLKNWFKLLKKGGYVLMREPTNESLKRGQGESPNEEGINIKEIEEFAFDNNGIIQNNFSFWSPMFHGINRILIRIGLGSWRKSKKLWKFALELDFVLIHTINVFYSKFKGDTVAIVLQKK